MNEFWKDSSASATSGPLTLELWIEALIAMWWEWHLSLHRSEVPVYSRGAVFIQAYGLPEDPRACSTLADVPIPSRQGGAPPAR